MSNDRMNEYYSQLEGYKIKKYLGEGDDGFPAFLLTAPHYKDIKVEVSRDPEGKDARLNIFIPYKVGEDDKRDIFVSDFKVVKQNNQEVEIYSNDDLKPYYDKHLK